MGNELQAYASENRLNRWRFIMQHSFDIIVIPLSFFLVLVLTEYVRAFLLKTQALDIPNSRSLHDKPVPRGGGWALLAVLFPLLIGGIAVLASDIRHAGIALAVFLLAAVSWIDDRRHVNPALRLFVHVLTAWLGSLAFSPEQTILGGAVPFWLDRTLMILGWVWFINLYNFMDGIDGITSVETVSISTGLLIVLAVSQISDPFAGFLALILIGSCMGFLAHNWHPAKIFLGDVGSVSLGYLVGFCLISLAVKGYPAAALILPLYYLTDSGITIARRALRGEKVWEAHRQHFYQKAALKAGSHSRVVALIVFADIGLILAAAFSVFRPIMGMFAGFLLVAILLRTMHKIAIGTDSAS